MTTVPVWFDALHVGDVTVADTGALGFSYSEAWLATEGAFPLSLTLPLDATAYTSEVISPWLANLLPEEEQLNILTRSLGLDRADILAVLKAIGGDTAGALSFGAPSERAAWTFTPLTEFYSLDDPGAALERHFQDLQQRPFLAGEEGVRLSLAGGRKKSALAVLDAKGTPVLRLPGDGDILAIPRNGAPSTIIVKPDNPILPGIVENEIYCLRLAQAIGLHAADATILTAGRRKAICVLRYDRRVSRTDALQRLHQEDFAQANGVPPGRKYERGTLPGPSLAKLLKTARHLSSVDALSLLDNVIFNLLVANTDAHAKNYALLLPVGAGPRLAPLYDVSTVLSWPSVTQFFAQNIAGRRRKPSDVAARHWDAIAVAAGYRPADVRARSAACRRFRRKACIDNRGHCGPAGEHARLCRRRRKPHRGQPPAHRLTSSSFPVNESKTVRIETWGTGQLIGYTCAPPPHDELSALFLAPHVKRRRSRTLSFSRNQ